VLEQITVHIPVIELSYIIKRYFSCTLWPPGIMSAMCSQVQDLASSSASSTASATDQAKPSMSQQQVTHILDTYFGLILLDCKPLPSWDDQNFHCRVVLRNDTCSGHSLADSDTSIPGPGTFEVVCRIANGSTSSESIQFQVDMMLHLHDNRSSTENARKAALANCVPQSGAPYPFPIVGSSESSDTNSTTTHTVAMHCDDTGSCHVVHVLGFVPGTLLADVRDVAGQPLMMQFGTFLAEMDCALESFKHTSMPQDLPDRPAVEAIDIKCQQAIPNLWDLDAARRVMASYCSFVPSTGTCQQLPRSQSDSQSASERPKKLDVIRKAMQLYERLIHPPLHSGSLRRAVVHNDANVHNVIVQEVAPSSKSTDSESDIKSSERDAESKSDADIRVVSLIDFDDVVRPNTTLVNNLAIAVTYCMLDKSLDHAISTAQAVTTGYHHTNPLTKLECELILPLVIARLGVSCCLCERQASLYSSPNPHATLEKEEKWSLLAALTACSDTVLTSDFHKALGMC
jgi:Ser/Thr protein kinase RdoA (MazF antagonist)